MLTEFLGIDSIRVNVDCKDWKGAVKAGCELLLKKGYIESSYEEAIIKNHMTIGPYMVVAPQIMLAHARPEDGAKKISLSLITLKNAIVFGNKTNDPVKLIITLATTSGQEHLKLLESLMELLSNEADVKDIMKAKTVSEVESIIKKYK